MLIPFGILSSAGSLGPVVFGAAYTFGGNTPTAINTIQKLDFASETRTTLVATTSATDRYSSASSNSGVASYQKVSNNSTTTVDKFLFTGETNSALATGLASNGSEGIGFADSGVASYIGRGRTGAGSSSDAIDKFAHSNDSRSTLGTGLTVQMASYPFSFANTGTAGYAGGGYSYSSGASQTAVNKFAFPSDTRSTLSALATPRDAMVAMENKGVAGYAVGGGNDGSSVTREALKWAFSTDTRSTVSNALSTEKQLGGHAGASDSGTAGFYFGGSLSSRFSAIEKLNFSNDTGSVLTATLAATTNFLGASSNNGVGY